MDLNGKKIAILAGRGALGAADELEQVAEKLGAPIVKALLGKAAVPDDSPYTTGQLGILGTRPSQEVLEECDTLLMVGTAFPYIEYLPKPGQARAVQIELDPMRLGEAQPDSVAATAFIKVPRPWTSVAMTASPMLPSATRNHWRPSCKAFSRW